MNSTGVLRHMTQEKNNLMSPLTHPLRQASYDTQTDGKTESSQLSWCSRRKALSWMNKHFTLAISRKQEFGIGYLYKVPFLIRAASEWLTFCVFIPLFSNKLFPTALDKLIGKRLPACVQDIYKHTSNHQSIFTPREKLSHLFLYICAPKCSFDG